MDLQPPSGRLPRAVFVVVSLTALSGLCAPLAGAQCGEVRLTEREATVHHGAAVDVADTLMIVGAPHQNEIGVDCVFLYRHDGDSWNLLEDFHHTGQDDVRLGAAVATTESHAALGGPGHDAGATGDAGTVGVISRDTGSWEVISWESPTPTTNGQFGAAVSISQTGDGVLLAVGEPGGANGTGAVHLYRRTFPTVWALEQTITDPQGAFGDEFGAAVAVDGGRLLVGAPGRDFSTNADAGKFLWYEFDGVAWNFVQAGISLRPDSRLGDAVTLDGDDSVVSAPGANGGAGQVYFNRWDGVEWEQVHYVDGQVGDGFGVSLDVEDGRCLVGSSSRDGTGAARWYHFNGATWVGGFEWTSSDAAAGDGVGSAVAFGERFTVLGAPFVDDMAFDQGAVYVFEGPCKLIGSDTEPYDRLGSAVAVSGDTAVVGASEDDYGSVFVFIRSGDSWTEQAKLISSHDAYSSFGKSVGISGDTVVVGAPNEDDAGTNSGAAYVFVRNGDSWIEQARLLSSDGEAFDYFGYSVSVSGDTAVVGSHRDNDLGDSSGSAYIFVREGDSWFEQAKLLPSDGVEHDFFGQSVSISGDTAVIGSPRHRGADYFSGAAYVFVRSGDSWTEQAKLLASDGDSLDLFGESVSICGDSVVCGTPYDEELGIESGSAYIFVRSGGDWTQQAKILAGDRERSDHFGRAVSIYGDSVVVGARYDDDVGEASGSAYLFQRTGSRWDQHAKLLAADGETRDELGISVAVGSGSVIIGAERPVGTGYALVFPTEHSCTVTYESFGQGLAGASGFVPTLSGSGDSCDPGGRFLHVRDVVGGAQGVFFVFFGKGEVDLLGGQLFIDFTQYWTLFPIGVLGPPGVPGAGYLDLPTSLDASGRPFDVHLQCVFFDDAAVRGASITNALTERVDG